MGLVRQVPEKDLRYKASFQVGKKLLAGKLAFGIVGATIEVPITTGSRNESATATGTAAVGNGSFVLELRPFHLLDMLALIFAFVLRQFLQFIDNSPNVFVRKKHDFLRFDETGDF